MGQQLDQVLTAAKRGLGLSEMMFADIKPELFARKPHFHDAGKEIVVECNHPAFVFGHLALYPARLAGFLKLDASAYAPPANWPDLFKAGAPCNDDPEGAIYPAKDVITAAFLKGYNAIMEQLAKADDSIMLQPHPDENIRAKFFPTLGTAVVFTLNSHVTFHIGQISTWRRCFGLPSIM